MTPRRFLLAFLRAVLLGGGLAGFARTPQASAQTAAGSNQVQQLQVQVQEVQLQGRVVCLAEEMHRQHGTELPTRHQHIWTLKTTNGLYYTLLEGKFSQAIFQDERVRAKELRVKGRLLPRSQALELTYFRSVKNGVLQNLYYYCEICAISTVSPEPCACCQAPVQLIEKPATERDE